MVQKGGASTHGDRSQRLAAAPVVVAGSDIQTYDFTVAGDSVAKFVLEATIENNGSGACDYHLRLNGAATVSERMIMFSTGGAPGGSRSTSNVAMQLGNATGDNGDVKWEVPHPESDAPIRLIYSRSSSVNGADAELEDISICYLRITTPDIGNEITQIGIGASIAGGIGQTSIIKLYEVLP